jgi:hypothetical protein
MLRRGLGKLLKGIIYTAGVLVAATLISGLLAGPIGAAWAGVVFFGVLGLGGATAIAAVHGKTTATKKRAHTQNVSSYGDLERQFAAAYRTHSESRFSDPAQRQAFQEQQAELLKERREDAEKQRKKEDAEFKKEQEAQRLQQQQGAPGRNGSGGGGLSGPFRSAGGTGSHDAYEASRRADEDRRRREDDLRERQRIEQMMHGPGKF